MITIIGMACHRAIIKPACGGKTTTHPTDCSLAGLIIFYRTNFAGDLAPEHFESLSTTLDFICGKPNGKTAPGEKYAKASHQRRMTVATVHAALQALNRLDACRFDDFDHLVEKVREIVEKKTVRGFGPLAIYDFSLRFGHKHRLLPEKFVYIQQGARDGAVGLRAAGCLQFANRDRKIPIEAFPPELQALGAMHIENFLCNMKEYLRNLKRHN